MQKCGLGSVFTASCVQYGRGFADAYNQSVVHRITGPKTFAYTNVEIASILKIDTLFSRYGQLSQLDITEMVFLDFSKKST